MLNLIKSILKTLNQILTPYTNIISKCIISKFKCRHKTVKHTHKNSRKPLGSKTKNS